MQIVWRYRSSFCANTYYGIIKSFEYSRTFSTTTRRRRVRTSRIATDEIPRPADASCYLLPRRYLLLLRSCTSSPSREYLRTSFCCIQTRVRQSPPRPRCTRRFCPSPRKISASTGRTPKLASLASLLFASLLKRFSACSRLNYPLFPKLFDLVATLNRISTTYHPPEPFPRRWISPRKS